MSRIEQELTANTDRIKRLRNALPMHSHRIKEREKEAKAHSERWMQDYSSLCDAVARQHEQLFTLLTCGLSHRRVMRILRRLKL